MITGLINQVNTGQTPISLCVLDEMGFMPVTWGLPRRVAPRIPYYAPINRKDKKDYAKETVEGIR